MLQREHDIFDGYGVEIQLPRPDDFLKVKETLTRMGEADDDTHTLTQMCHILHKRGRYRIMHYRELLALDGRNIEVTETDRMIRNTIADLLDRWELVTILDEDVLVEEGQRRWVRVIPHKEKEQWKLIAKYTIGRNRANPTWERWSEG